MVNVYSSCQIQKLFCLNARLKTIPKRLSNTDNEGMWNNQLADGDNEEMREPIAVTRGFHSTTCRAYVL